ncbi:zinc-finger homeodomain protein 4-like [Phragmites australis]|uniref:zinc-finger homeodomain protein 4-like n=1 Tax=Phragmites australis TaxID=29695 RepID=UPI002D790044|nr:zinc-finger homeodomain protein 4-like [Phragmites australis]
MVSIVPLQQRRTEASPAAARGIFSLERRRRGEEGGGMDLSGTQGELPIPMHANVAPPYSGVGGGGHVLQVHHEHGNNNGQSSPALPSPHAAAAEERPEKKRGAAAGAGIGGGCWNSAAKYRECLKNHAAAIGGNATDGCGEFMPSGEEGSLEALKCSACGCHRNFHRKEVDDDFDVAGGCAAHAHGHGPRAARRLLAPAMPQHKNGAGGLLVSADPYGAYAAARALPPPPGHPHHHHYVMPLSVMHTSESDEMAGDGPTAAVLGSGGGGGGGSSSSKKRFRTKFTVEQKARMLDFAERVGWRLQKLDDGMVQAFCQEIGVKRRVLKVWMHNNKHNLATKRLEASPQAQAMPAMPSPPPLQMSMPMPVMPPPQPGPSSLRGPSSPPPLKL